MTGQSILDHAPQMNRLVLKLPPSVNALRMTRKNSYQSILRVDGRDYIYRYAFEVADELKRMKHVPIDGLFHLNIHWYLPNRNCDSHNYEKGLFDMLEKAGFVTDDKYIMSRTQSVNFDSKNPRVVIEW